MKVHAPLVVIILVIFLITGIVGPMPVYAQDIRLPAPGGMVHLSPEFNPLILKGIKVHLDNPFRFDFILDQGDAVGAINNRPYLKDEATKLIKYFLASLTIPEKDLWVNLSPYEKDRIIPQSFGLTEMGRDLLAEDYMLKQITASLIYPENEIGKKFWKCIYQEAQQKFGTTNIPVNTFNKVWIVPEKAVVYENAKAGTAYVVESKLKVMLEQDYLSLEKHEGINFEKQLPRTPLTPLYKKEGKIAYRKEGENKGIPPLFYKEGVRGSSKDISALGSQIVREIVIPELTKEVNENKNFAQLRQVYNSLILATWYKKKIKDSILEQVYIDKNKVAGVNIDDPKEKEKIYQRYLQAFKKGVYNYVKEEIDPTTQETLPRKYFSGGFGATKLLTDLDIKDVDNKAMLNLLAYKLGYMLGRIKIVTAQINPFFKKARQIAQSQSIVTLKADFSKGINGNEQQIEEMKNDLIKEGINSGSFKFFGTIVSSSFQMPSMGRISSNPLIIQVPEKYLMRVYEHKNGLKIIQKRVEKDQFFRHDGDWNAIKELAEAKRDSIVPLFTINSEPGVYYELDLRDFDYKRLDDIGRDWLTDERRRSIISSVNNGLRFNRDFWYEHGHLHGGNILIKIDEKQNIVDTRIIDFSFLYKQKILDNLVLVAIRDHVKKLKKVANWSASDINLDWMDLSGFEPQGMIHTVNSCFGSILNGADFSGVKFNEKIRLTNSDTRGLIIRGAEMYGVYFDESLDMTDVDFNNTLLGGFETINTLYMVRNLDKAKNLRHARLWFNVPVTMSDHEIVARIALKANGAMLAMINRFVQRYAGRPGMAEWMKENILTTNGGDTTVKEVANKSLKITSIFTSQRLPDLPRLRDLPGKLVHRLVKRLITPRNNPNPAMRSLGPKNQAMKAAMMLDTQINTAKYVLRNRKQWVEGMLADLQKIKFPENDNKEGSRLPNDQEAARAMMAKKAIVKLEGSKGPGGIDLTPANMHLQTQNNGGEIRFHLDPAMLAQYQNAPGFVPVIINIQPLKSLQEFLGLNQPAQSKVG